MLFVSAILLLYSAVVVPFQICMWDYSDPCNIFPTLQFDIFVDTFFLVLSVLYNSNVYSIVTTALLHKYHGLLLIQQLGKKTLG
jgi:hypothetical protein